MNASTLIVFLLTGISSGLSHRDRPQKIRFTTLATVSDSLPQFQADPEKWPPVLPVDAQKLAKDQGDAWQKAVKAKNILLGLGPNGNDKLKQLINSSSLTSKTLFAQMIKAADLSLSQPIPSYKAPTQAMQSGVAKAVANNETWMRPGADQLVMLSVAAAATGNAAYKQRVHDLVMALCSFPSWGSAPKNADLAAGHVSRAIAMAWNWNPDLWTGEDRKLVIDTVRSRVSTLCKAIYGSAGGYWAGMYTGNHNQVSAAGAGMAGAAFINDIPEAKEWLAASWLNFNEVVKRCYADGGGPEGTAYWSGGLSFIIQFIESVNGILPSYKLYDSPFLKNAAAFRINNSTPGFNGVVSWGDSYRQDFSGPEHFLLRLSSQYNDDVAQYVATHQANGLGGGDDVKAWAWLWSLPALDEKEPTQPDYHADVYDLVNTRSGWKDDDYLFSLKSGYNNRSHSHLDAGAFALAIGNEWLLPTPVYGKGKDFQDFYDQRRGRWSYQSNSTEANSTLVINKEQQRSDPDARGNIDHYASYDRAMTAECDLTQAYNSATSVRRMIFHRRGEYVIVEDAAVLKDAGQVEWLLQAPRNAVTSDNGVNIQGKSGSVTVHLLSPQTNLALRDPLSEKKDMAEVRKTLSASVAGKTASFIAVIEPRINGRESVERTYSLTSEGAVDIKTPDSDERLYSTETGSPIADKQTGSSAVARLLYIKAQANKLSEVIVTDATKLSIDNVALSASSPFSASLIRSDQGAWKITVASGKSITLKGNLKAYPQSGSNTSPAGGQITGPGNYVLR